LPQKEPRPTLFPEFIDSHREQLEAALGNWTPVSPLTGTERFNQGLQYAVFPGGKRLRAYLTYVASKLCDTSDEQALKLSCAIEFIHTSSIILDDLPSMDDADLRRNRPTLHLLYGEGHAILIALAFLNQAYALFADSVPGNVPAQRLQQLTTEVTRRIGNVGMIAGQAAELLSSGSDADGPMLDSRELKTTALMRLMMVAGGIVSGSSHQDLEALATFGESLGRAYQIYDDIADAMGNRQSTGKSVRQDSRHCRPSITAGLDGEESRRLATAIIKLGTDALNRFDNRHEAQLLKSAADCIVASFNQTVWASKATIVGNDARNKVASARSLP
jgi:geranylgeranyl pyrophosphate synthase